MAKTESTMLALGTNAPDFRLPDPDGKSYTLADFQKENGTLVMFICNHCPFVVHIREELSALCKEYQEKGFGIVAINSNDIQTHPADSPDNMKVEIENFGYSFPYLFDESQEVAKAYKAACTPDFFLFDNTGKLFYRGQFDSSRPGNDLPIDGSDLRFALTAILEQETIPEEEQQASIGCNIKWRAGNAPDYFSA